MRHFSQDETPKAPNTALEDLLAAQADALISGAPFEDSLPSLAPADQAAAHSLMLLANRLSAGLAPVTPDPAFVARLHAELAAQASTAAPANVDLMLRWRNLPQRYKVAARIGGLTLTAGLALLASRRVLEALTRFQRRERTEDADLSLNAAG
ncbi:MAG: hypothetical protein DYG88_05650 [Chloroflexi bacterium CFX4]|nr:hypothetical protein [Chloroflexi bacterium CFX4]MDL1924612.1 hypothetical protein [Chloroflexi bacterium CFX3]